MVIRVMIRRVALVLLSLCLASSVAANTYPGIEKSQVVKLDVRTIEKNANSGAPFELTLGGAKLTVAVNPAPVFPKEGVTFVEFAKDGSAKETVIQGNYTYAGEIAGEDPATTEVRLTIADGVLEGYVLTSSDWWFIEPLVRFDPKAGSDQYLVYATRDTNIAAVLPEDNVNDEVFDFPLKDDKIPLAMVADLEYFNQSDHSFQRVMQRHATLVNSVNGIYLMQLGREFRVPRIALDRGVDLVGTHVLDLMYQFKLYMTPQRFVQLRSLIAHLTTGKDLDFDTLGLGVRRGFRSLSMQSTTLNCRNTILAARFIGSNFEAVPEEAEEWLVAGLIVLRTLEHRNYDARTTIPRFSDGRMGPDHNNVGRMCIILAERGFPCR
jgi:hypothetical protein